MEVTVEVSEGLERAMRVRVPEDRVQGEVDKRLGRMAREARIPGFRPGKAPVRVVAQRYGRQVRDEVVGEMLQTSFRDALAQEQLRPAGSPTIDAVEAEPGAGFVYTARFDVYPEFELPDLSTVSVARPTASVGEADVDAMIETLRGQRRTWHDAGGPAESGHRVRVDFEGTMDGERVDRACGEGVTLELGSGRMIPGFEDGLIGAGAGEERTLELEFPADYPAEELAGKPIRFAVKLSAVERGDLPEVDEEFVRGFGVPDGTVEAFRVEVRGNMERELAEAVANLTKQRVMDALLEAHTLDLPRSLVDEEVERMREQARREFLQAALDPGEREVDAAILEAPARRRVGLGLILAELVRSNNLVADPQRVRQRIDTIASTFQDPEQVVSWYYGDRERLSEVESAVLEDSVVEWVLERASVTEEARSFDELLNPGQTSSRT